MHNYRLIIDLSLPLNSKTVIYPSNPEMTVESLKSESGNFLSKITFGSHTGTHIDAPSHSVRGGKSIDQIDLERFIGPCRVIDCTASKVSISLEDVKRSRPKKEERLLFKTSNSKRGFEIFYEDFVFLSPEAAAYLATSEVALVGIDSLSIKQKGSPDNTPHTALLSKGIPILEGIDLSQVSPGDYYLIVLPLRFTGLDGSPARAVLLK
ncbi:cyclase family protein [Candidatus Roizmanbacteria bacterium]|nr:cyclase family protein [Candidatus Roizmanbacteria bacterium]